MQVAAENILITMKYVVPVPIRRADAESQFASGNIDEICDALVRITYNESDWQWAQECCLRFAEHPDSGIRRVAANCIGDLARIHKCLDLDRVFPVLRKLLTDEKTIGYAEDALSDIHIFMGKKLPKPRKLKRENP